jgi:hypothetical protein
MGVCWRVFEHGPGREVTATLPGGRICVRRVPPWSFSECVGVMGGESERHLTVFEFSGKSRANARDLSAATRG